VEPTGSDPFASSLPPPPESSPQAVSSEGVVRASGGGVSYGEVNLEGGDEGAEVSLDGPPHSGRQADDDMEFGAIPQEHDSGPAASTPGSPDLQVPVAVAGPRAPAQIELPRPRRRGLRITIGVIALLLVGGGALALVPTLGPFGAYWIMDQVNAGKYRQLTASTVAKARSDLSTDTAPAAAKAERSVEHARAQAKRVKALAAYAAYVGYARELRFGDQSEVEARAKVQLKELSEEHDVEYLELARAAQAAEQGQLARARQSLQKIAAKRPRDIDVEVTLGEIALRAREPKTALLAWQKALAIEKSARTFYGLARAQFASGDFEGARKSAEQALKRSPGHVGARVLLARFAWRKGRNEARATKLLTEVVKDKQGASDDEIVAAQTLLGDIDLARSRISHAETAYGEALQIDPKAAGALRGLGDALYRAGRYSEALARFEAATQADPDDIPSKVGVAKTKIALERLQDAREMMKKLREAHPKSMLVAYWYGKAQEALGSRKEAEQGYRAAIANAGKNPDAVDAYVALAMLLGQQGRNDEATKTLDEARKKLPDSPAIHKAMGKLALSQGRYDLAAAEFRKALELDPDDVSAKFQLAIALRQSRHFDEASKLFDAVAKVDRDYPGLALERGLLYEASGRTEEALKAYESALAKAPNDLDLMLRVGCGKVAAGRAKEAEKLLRKVLGQRPNSAETNHCLGRALLVEGTNLAQALKTLQRAVELDPNRAEYWLYVGWAANEAGRVQTAEKALQKALDIDQNLADAYWQRGVLRYRQGAVKDAIKDLDKALELRPSRNEAHAALADSYYDLGRTADAMSEWQKATAAQPDNATWHFRYGKLLEQNHKDAEAQQQLGKAVELGEQMDDKPRWLWEAHYLLARAIGPHKEAAKHWEAFLRTGPRDSPYRAEAKAALAKLGRPWQGG
jgi:tetratricopeptide (TPR) repeat protein